MLAPLYPLERTPPPQNSSTFHVNLLMAGERAASMVMMGVVVVLFVYYGGLEVIDGSTSVGTYVATLRYVHMQQRGVKMVCVRVFVCVCVFCVCGGGALHVLRMHAVL